METRANHLLVGGFVIAVILLALGSLLWLGKFGSDRDAGIYDIVFAESVIGLSKGSVVSYNGVSVGEVLSLAVDENDLGRVVVRVRINQKDLIRTDTEVTLGFAAVTGVADIRLAGGSLTSPPLYRDDGVPTMIASPSPLAKLAASGQDIMFNLNDLAARVAELLSDENIARVNSVLGNVDTLVASVSDERDVLVDAIRQLSQVSGELETVLSSVDATAVSVQRLMDNEVHTLLESTNAAVVQLDKLSDELGGMLEDNRAALAGFSQQGLRQVGPALNELRTTLSALQQLSDQLSRSDSALLGSPQPREFKPR